MATRIGFEPMLSLLDRQVCYPLHQRAILGPWYSAGPAGRTPETRKTGPYSLCGREGSNLRPPGFQPSTLPTELLPHFQQTLKLLIFGEFYGIRTHGIHGHIVAFCL